MWVLGLVSKLKERKRKILNISYAFRCFSNVFPDRGARNHEGAASDKQRTWRIKPIKRSKYRMVTSRAMFSKKVTWPSGGGEGESQKAGVIVASARTVERG